MSLGSEARSEIDVEISLQRLEFERRVKNGIWITKDERRIKITEMTDKHIENVIAMLKRMRSEDAEIWLVRFEEEQRRRQKNNGNQSNVLPHQ